MLSLIYNYEKLLDRAIEQLPKKRLKKTERFVVPEPEVIISGKRTIIQNFKQICDVLNREPRIVLRYLLKELAIPGALEGTAAVLLGEKSRRAVQAVLNRFIKDYVYCPICGQPDTNLIKEKKMMFIICMACGAKSAVKSF